MTWHSAADVFDFFCDCRDHALDFAATADPNGNCIAFELGDVVTEIGAYRGSATASGCPDYPGSLRLLPGNEERLPVIPSLKTKIKIKNRQTKE